MSVSTFHHDEAGYATYLAEGSAFVATNARPGHGHIEIHQSDCALITLINRPGVKRTNYKKVVSRDLPELIGWSEANSLGGTRIHGCVNRP